MARVTVITVVHPDSMDTETFTRHMNARHADSLGGLRELKLPTRYLALCYRNFHRRLHEIRPGLGHEHGEFEPDK
jgi:hypothetical protein